MAKLNKQYVINGSAGIERLNLYTTLEEVNNLGKKIHLADWNIDCYYAIGDIDIEYATKKRLSINGVVYAGLKESAIKRKKVYIFEKGLTDFIIPEGATKITYRLCGGGSGMYLSSAPINQQISESGWEEIETPTFMKVESLSDIYEHNTATDPAIVDLFNSDTTGEVSKLSGRSSFIVFPDSTTINAKGGELNILPQNTFTKDNNIVRKSIGLGKLTNSLITDNLPIDPEYINDKFLSLQPEYNSAKANWFPGVYTFIDGVTKEEYLPNSTISVNDIAISPTSGFVKFSGLYTKEDNTIDYSLAFNPTDELLDSNIKKSLIYAGSNLASSTEAIATIRENLKRRVNRLPGQGKVIEIFNNAGVFSFTRFYNDFFSIVNDIYGLSRNTAYPYGRSVVLFSLSIPNNYNFFTHEFFDDVYGLDKHMHIYPDLVSHNDVNMPTILKGIHGRAYSDNSTLIRPRNFQAEKIFANLPTEREWNQSDFGNNLYYVDRLKLLGLYTLDLLNYDPVAFYTVIFEDNTKNPDGPISTLADVSYNNGKDTKYRGMYIDYVTNAKDSHNNVLEYSRFCRTRPMDEKFYPNLHYIGALNLSIDTDIKSPDIDNFETLNDNEDTFGLHVNILDCCTNDLKLDPSTYEYGYINGLGIDLNNLRIKPRGYTVYYNDNKGNEISKYEIKYGASVKLNHLKYFEDYITEWQAYNNRNFYTLEGLNDFVEVMNGCLVGTPSEEKVGEFKVGPNETYKAGDVLRIGVGKRGKIYHDRLKWEIDDMIEERICEEESDGICILEIETYKPVKIDNLTPKVDGQPIKNQFGLFDNIAAMSDTDKSKLASMLTQYDFVDASSLGKETIWGSPSENKTVLFANTVPYNTKSDTLLSSYINKSTIYGKLFNSSIETNNIPTLYIDYTNRASKNIFSEISGLLLKVDNAFVHDVRSLPVLNLKKMTVKYDDGFNNLYYILKNQNRYNYTTQPQKIILRDLNYMQGLYDIEYNYSNSYFKDVDLFKVYNMLFNYKAFRDNKVADLYYLFFYGNIKNITPNLEISIIKNPQMKLYNGNMYLNYDTGESVPLNYRNIRLRFKQAITTSKPNIVENLYINIEPTTVPNINDFVIEMYSNSTGKCVLRGMDIIKKINIFAISNIKDIIFIGGNLDLEVNRFIVNNSTKVEDLSMINVTLVSTNILKPLISFSDCSNLKKLPTVLNLENTFSLRGCFYNCKSLTEDEYRRFCDNFIQDKLTDISSIFHSSSINFIPDFKSSKITEMRFAFGYTSIDLDKSSLSMFDNKSVNFYNLFYKATLYSNSVDMIQTLLNKLGEVDLKYSTYIFSNANFRVNGVDYINKLSMTLNSSENSFSTIFYGLNRDSVSQTIHEFYIKINSSSSANLILTKFFGDRSKIDILNINTDKVTTQLTSIGYIDIINIHELRLNINLNNNTSKDLFDVSYIPTSGVTVTRSCAVYLTLDTNMSQDSYNNTFTNSLPNISKFVISNVNKNLNYMFDIDDSVRYEGLMETISNCAKYPTENFTITVRAKSAIINDPTVVQDAVDWYNSTNESAAKLTVNITYI